MNGLNLEKAIAKERSRSTLKTPDSVLAAFKALLAKEDVLDETALENIFGGSGALAQLDFRKLDTERIYSAGQIKALCTRYRLRFLNAKYFRGEIPHEAVAKVRRLQKDQQQVFDNFMIVAPAPMFRLEERDKDPLLFLPLGADRYYLVHKWGSDLSMFRRFLVMPFRNFKSLLATVALLAFFIVMMIPDAVIMGPYDQSSGALRVIFFFYLFIAFSGLTALYGFSRLKNFNENLWDSRYLD